MSTAKVVATAAIKAGRKLTSSRAALTLVICHIV